MGEIRFGTGGWRAIIGDDFIKANIQKVAAGVSLLAKETKSESKPIVIGFDRRFLSEKAMKWITEVFSGYGLHSEIMKRSTPTPLVMYMVKEKDYDYGIEITASHNSSEYNGIKLIIKEGRDAPVEVTKRVEDIIKGLKDEDIRVIPFDKAISQGLVQYLKNPFNEYIDSILNKTDVEAIKNAGLRILFDPMHGSGNFPLNTILTTCRCTVDLMNSNRDAYFGGFDPAPGIIQLQDLRYRVVSEHYDIGVALDGDGDRLGIIDSEGEYISANKILVMLYYYLHEYKGWKGPVVRNMATTHMLDKVANYFGEKCYEVPIGFKWISSKMEEVDAILGGESSGGLTVRGHINGKDSVYAGTLFVEMLAKIGKPLNAFWSELEEKFCHYEMVEYNTKMTEECKASIGELIFKEKILPDFKTLIGKEPTKVSYADGCKAYFDNSFVICRFSGTEPVLRIFAESDSNANASRLIDCFLDYINLKG